MIWVILRTFDAARTVAGETSGSYAGMVHLNESQRPRFAVESRGIYLRRRLGRDMRGERFGRCIGGEWWRAGGVEVSDKPEDSAVDGLPSKLSVVGC
jgi:hypothetical protein